MTDHLPASTFSMLYCLFILLLAPFFTAFWYHLKKRNIIINPIYKLGIGILLAAIGIAIFAIAALTNFIISGILLGYVFLSAGELVLAPAIYTAISNLAPEDMKSTMMGCWLLFVALGGYLSSVLATAAHTFAEKYSPFHSMYFSVFGIIALFTFIVGLIAVLVTPKFTKMMN